VGSPVKTKVATKVAFSRRSGPKWVRRSMPILSHYAIATRAITRPHDWCAALFPRR
jgi:hypothetical protein